MRSVLVFLFLMGGAAQAEVPFYSCSSKQLQKFVVYIQGEKPLLYAPLTEAQEKALSQEIDLAFDCDEGVVLEGPLSTDSGAAFAAICSKDSLGSSKVVLNLSCQKEFTIN